MSTTDQPRVGDGGRAEASRRMLVEAWAVIAHHHGVRLGDGPRP